VRATDVGCAVWTSDGVSDCHQHCGVLHRGAAGAGSGAGACVGAGVIGVVISAIGAAVTWNKGPAFGPHWYPLLLVVVAMPCAWVPGEEACEGSGLRPVAIA
jgi:hypothetical protein